MAKCHSQCGFSELGFSAELYKVKKAQFKFNSRLCLTVQATTYALFSLLTLVFLGSFGFLGAFGSLGAVDLGSVGAGRLFDLRLASAASSVVPSSSSSPEFPQYRLITLLYHSFEYISKFLQTNRAYGHRPAMIKAMKSLQKSAHSTTFAKTFGCIVVCT